MPDKISALHGIQGSATGQDQEVNNDLAVKLDQLNELVSANTRQREAEAAAMKELQAEMSSDPDLMTAAMKSLWDGQPGVLFLGLRQRCMKEREAQRDELDKVQLKLQQAEVVIAQDTAAKKSLHAQLQGMEACLVAEKAKSAEATELSSKYAELSIKFQEKLKEQCGTSQLAPASKQMIEQQMTEQHVRPLQDSLAAAQERCDSLQAHIQALTAAERTAALLAQDFEDQLKAATKEAYLATQPLKMRIASLETKGKARATTIQALNQKLTMAQENGEAGKAAEQAAGAAAAKAQADAKEQMHVLQTKHKAELAALRAELEEARGAHANSTPLANETAADADTASATHCAMDSESHAMQQEGMPAHILKQPSGDKAEVSVAEQGSSEHACCELCEQAGHNKEDCPLVVAAQESEVTPEAEEADWQVVAGKTSKAQAKGHKGKKSQKKAGKGSKGARGNKGGKGSKIQGKEEKRGGGTMVITAHRNGSNGWEPVKRPHGSRDGSGSHQPRSS